MREEEGTKAKASAKERRNQMCSKCASTRATPCTDANTSARRLPPPPRCAARHMHKDAQIAHTAPRVSGLRCVSCIFGQPIAQRVGSP
eukprot:6202966-Pleurochrysis_carterae.AAC.1